jgi:hypothetical protein
VGPAPTNDETRREKDKRGIRFSEERKELTLKDVEFEDGHKGEPFHIQSDEQKHDLDEIDKLAKKGKKKQGKRGGTKNEKG